MQIPDEVFRDAFGAAVLKMPHEDYLRHASQVVAEWARRVALEEAARVATNDWFHGYVSRSASTSVAVVKCSDAEDAIRALLEE